MKNALVFSPPPTPHKAPQPISSSSSVPCCPELDLSVICSPDPEAASQSCLAKGNQRTNQRKACERGRGTGRGSRQVCSKERAVITVTSEHGNKPSGHACGQKQTVRVHHHGSAVSQLVESSGTAANSEPWCLDGAQINSTLALKAELESAQEAQFDSNKAVQEALRKSEWTKNLINSRATEGVNLSRSRPLFHSLINVSVQEDQVIGQALQDRLVLAASTHNQKATGRQERDRPSLHVFPTSDLQRQRPLVPEEEDMVNKRARPVPCPAHLTFDLYRRQRRWEATP